MSIAVWGPKEWESWVNELLFAHFGHGEYIRIPDDVKGDGGIEGYAKSGFAYQCYAPQSSFSEKDRCEKIKSKINADLNKLRDNQSTLGSILSETVIGTWFLVTPDVRDKDLVAYGHAKGIEWRNLAIPYLHASFDVQVIDDKVFPQARRKILESAGEIPIRIDQIVDPAQAEVDAWGATNQGEWKVISQKIDSLHSLSDSEKSELKKVFSCWRIRGEELMSSLQGSFQEQHQSIIVLRHQLESRVSAGSALSADAPGQRLEAIMQLCRDEIKARIPGLSQDVITEITYAIAAYWMVRCPLKFREVQK